MKIAYTGWTWLINHKDNEKFELEQSFKECKYLGYDYVENFAFITKFFNDEPDELIDMIAAQRRTACKSVRALLGRR